MAIAEDLLAAIPPGAMLTVDTAPVIYYLEDHPVYAHRFAALFDAAAEGRIHIVVSAVTLAEVLGLR